MSKISVVVPVYNVQKYLKGCVDSILGQTFCSFEVILVDDGSTDDCGKICDNYAENDDRVVVIHRENGGLSEARNTGIEWALKNSDSEWITFIDSDDKIHEDYLKMLYESAIRYNVDLSVCNWIKTTDENLSFEKLENDIKVFSPEDLWCYKQPNTAWGKLYRKSEFREVRYPKGLLHEDAFVTYKLIFKQNRVVFIEDCLYHYLLRTNSITKSQWNPRRYAELIAIKKQLKFYQKNKYHNAAKLTAVRYVLFIKNHLEALRKSNERYLYFDVKLNLMYKFYLLKYHRLFPINENIKNYRFAFPCFVKLYKKYTYLKMK